MLKIIVIFAVESQ